MEQTPIENQSSKRHIIIDDFDEFNLDDLSFKPINKGLGFHHNEKRTSFKKSESPTIRKHMGKPLSRETAIKTKPQGAKLVQTGISNLGVSQNMSSVTSKSSLDMFYGDSSSSKPKTTKANNKLEAKIITREEASHFISFVSWLVDFISIALFVLITIALFVFVSGIEFNELLGLVSKADKILFVSLVFSTIYIFYFSIFDLASSPGKALLGLNLEKIDGNKLKLTDTFVRSIVSLFSILSLGLLSLSNLSGKISKTRIVS